MFSIPVIGQSREASPQKLTNHNKFLSVHLRHLPYFYCDSIFIFWSVFIISQALQLVLLKFDKQKHFSDLWLLNFFGSWL